jgi:hypothetical protein
MGHRASGIREWRPTMAEKDEPQSSEAPRLNVVGELVALGPSRKDLLAVYGRWINDFVTKRMLGLPPHPGYKDRSKAENDPSRQSDEIGARGGAPSRLDRFPER